MKIQITLLIYLYEGKEDIFQEFESKAIPTIYKHNGKLLLRLRPTERNVIDASIETPYEIHLVEFNSEQDFINFTKDEERKQFLHLKEESIKETILIKGTAL